MNDLIEPHDPLPNCDCGDCSRHERNRLRLVLQSFIQPEDAPYEGDALAEVAKLCEDYTAAAKQLDWLRRAVAPFAAIVSGTSGRIPTERLSLANWHDLVKAFNRR